MADRLAVRMYSRLAYMARAADLNCITMRCPVESDPDMLERVAVLQSVATTCPKWKNINHYGYWGEIKGAVLSGLPWPVAIDITNSYRGQVWSINIGIYPGVPHGV